MSKKSLLEIQNLSISLPDGGDRRHAIENLHLKIIENEILCVVGESGSGKSMMARSIMGLLPKRLKITEGKIKFEDRYLNHLKPKQLQEIRGLSIAMIFQEPMSALNPLHSIGKQIEEVLLLHTSINKKERRKRILEMLSAVHLPDPQQVIHAYPHEISGGQRQRAMIAMALILEPKILIADEPTTALDVTTQAQILKLIRDLQIEKQTGVIFITHDFGVVAEIADRIAVMKDGQLVEENEAQVILNSPKHIYTQELIRSVPDLKTPKLLDSSKPVLLKVDNLEKTYKRRRGILSSSKSEIYAVNKIQFTLREGETIGLVGESGSGKSTVARCILKLVSSDGGAIFYKKEDITQMDRKAMMPYRRDIQMVFQDPYGSLNPRLTVGQMVAQGPIIHGEKKIKAFQKAEEILDLVGLGPLSANRYPHEFSGGQRQRIGIARALALDPKILIADEPVSALDVSIQAQVLKLLGQIKQKLNFSMLFITHDLRVAAQVCDKIAVMYQGNLVEMGSTGKVFEDPQHEYTKSLLESIPGRNWINPYAKDL
jgi:peptide/nickel transport system ATP-binding protein|tara:strand:- start:4540 stop:6168 length:1629 start_codon:yes stop_codon:yes gene_type:complete